eukprot:TRINITY_DN1121_c0_g1_i1.p1 TRINITY_DN1121_c0_g1~~TRINITY_DN1121_c0_g1_i1.p1  ORF type:complete len:239 (+),score=45.33 TRINITY_DN1121_c0_g1_i1:47-718(+)
MPKFAKDRRFVQFTDGSCDLSVDDAKSVYSEFCKELFEKMTKDRVHIKQYFRDLNFSVSGRAKLNDMVRKHRRAVELKSVNKRYMRLIFKQMIDRAKLREASMRDSWSRSPRRKKRSKHDRRGKRSEHSQMSSGRSKKENEDKFKIDDTKLKEWDNFDLDDNAFPNGDTKKQLTNGLQIYQRTREWTMSESDDEGVPVVHAPRSVPKMKSNKKEKVPTAWPLV